MRNLLYLFILSFALAACGNPNAETKSAGVVVHGYESAGWIQNTNTFPVRIKRVTVDRGESTKWIEVFAPGDKKQMCFVSAWSGFHIHTLDGVEIGWIKPEKNGQTAEKGQAQ